MDIVQLLSLKERFSLYFNKVRIGLFLAFTFLLTLQISLGFKSFDDYLILFLYALFLNDVYLKMNNYSFTKNFDQDNKRKIMTVIFLVLFSIPFIFDSYGVENNTRALFYKIAFLVWAQIFLIDSYLKFKNTQSKKWLLITNLAATMIIVSAFI